MKKWYDKPFIPMYYRTDEGKLSPDEEKIIDDTIKTLGQESSQEKINQKQKQRLKK